MGTDGSSRGRRAGAVVLAIIFGTIAALAILAAIIYYTKASQSLPGFLPGRRLGVPGHDTTRGLAATFTAVVALVVAGFLLRISRVRKTIRGVDGRTQSGQR